MEGVRQKLLLETIQTFRRKKSLLLSKSEFIKVRKQFIRALYGMLQIKAQRHGHC